ncbi:MAG TPA: sigma 54-interacting transcriptional regulator [Anaerolineaceae bacterium]|nr:sigma 54-interacting transcriptional regulator [Anaerolineaceae bacterium]
MDKLLHAWTEFTSHEHIVPEVSPIVASSWERCRARINPFQTIKFNKLNPDHFLAAQVASFDLISIARPIMEDISINLKSNQEAVVLLNGTGYILDMQADSKVLELLAGMGIATGELFTEGHVGTNALGLALTERMPVEVYGPEHYCFQFHDLADAAAPVFDVSGRVLGVLGLLTTTDRYQPYSLSLVIAGAKAIEAQRQADSLLAENNSQLAQLIAILDTISEGIVVWNGERVLIHINNYATRVMERSAQGLVGQKTDDFLSYPPFIQAAIDAHEPLTDVETNLIIGQKTVNCILSLRFVVNKNGLQWIIATFRPITEVRQLIHRQVGAHARLTLDDIPGDSPQMKRVQTFVKSAALAKASILIRGEVGTGKNVLAGAIHNESLRREGPFIIFACSSVPNELAVSELIGYEEGPASKRPGGRPSKFELAQGGTLFFQDVDALPLEAQAILLNVLELGMVQRMGGDRPIEVDLRVVVSTAAKIEKLVVEGRFRRDLFYRLSAFTITLPSLRERPKDIPMIVERICSRLSRQLNHPLSLGPGVLEVMKKYPWPGNIRELEAVLGPAASMVGPDGVIELAHLPVPVRNLSWSMAGDLEEHKIQPWIDVERQTIVQAAELCRGNLSRMAQVLGIGRTTLWRKIKKYGVYMEDYRNTPYPDQGT